MDQELLSVPVYSIVRCNTNEQPNTYLNSQINKLQNTSFHCFLIVNSLGGTSSTLMMWIKEKRKYGKLPRSGTEDGDLIWVPHTRLIIVMVRGYEINPKKYTFLSGTTCSCILDLINSRSVLVKSTLSNKIDGPKLHCYIPLVLILQKLSSQNSSNRQQQRTKHVMGSKNFSQCSFELVIIRYTNLVLPLYDAILVCWIFWHPRETKKLVKSQVIFFGGPLTQNMAHGQILYQLQYM